MIWAIAERLLRAEDRDQRDVLLQGDEVVEQRRRDPAHRLRQDHVAQRLRLGQPDRERRVALAAVDRVDPGAVDLGDVGAVGERRARSPPSTTGSVGRPGQLAAPGSRSRSGRRAGSSGCRGRRRRRRSPAAAAGTAPAARLVRHQRDDAGRATSTATSTMQKSLTSSQKPLEDVGEGVLEDRPGEERLADLGPAGAGQDQRREAAEDDDAWRPRRSPAAPVRGGASRGLAHAARRSTRRLRRLARQAAAWSASASSGAPAAWLIQRWVIFSSSPEDFSSSTAWETQAVSGEPLSSSAPHWSPPGALNWPTIVAPRDLGRGQVERGRQVDDDGVDLARSSAR